ncbi:hypothetical protein [Neobacillus citreus]|nr:hypothetical protein [Neobacillus citreus]
MFIFIAGLLTGAFMMLFIMSLMVAAKKGDQQMEDYFKGNKVY